MDLSRGEFCVLALFTCVFVFNPLPHRDAFERFCKQSRPRSGNSCKSCLIWVYSVCLWKYDLSDPTLVDLISKVELQWLERAWDHEKKF